MGLYADGLEPREAPAPRQVPLQALSRQMTARPDHGSRLALDGPIDFSRCFVCPTLTPLYYTASWRALGDGHRLRYNQLMGMAFNEVIGFIERTFSGSVLACLTGLARRERGRLQEGLEDCLLRFLADERDHSEWFRKLNRLSQPDWYRARDYVILQVRPLLRRALSFAARHPVGVSAVLWVMLLMEEHSIEVSRRCLRLGEREIEPCYAAVHRAHLEDEVRHVQLDWHLVEQVFGTSSATARRLNAALLSRFLAATMVRPTAIGARAVTLLAAEFPDLAPLCPRLLAELHALATDRHYQAMMFSRETTPIAFSLFDRYQELWSMRRVLITYLPAANGVMAS